MNLQMKMMKTELNLQMKMMKDDESSNEDDENWGMMNLQMKMMKDEDAIESSNEDDEEWNFRWRRWRLNLQMKMMKTEDAFWVNLQMKTMKNEEYWYFVCTNQQSSSGLPIAFIHFQVLIIIDSTF